MSNWEEIVASPEFRDAPREVREEVRNEFWRRVIRPELPVEHISSTKREFMARTSTAVARQQLPDEVQYSIAAGAGRGGQGGPTAEELANANPPTVVQRVKRGLSEAFTPKPSAAELIEQPRDSDDPVAPSRPLIETRGAPMSDEMAAGVDAVQRTMLPGQRRSVGSSPGWRGAAARAANRNIEEQNTGLKTVRELSGSVEHQAERYTRHGAGAEAATAKARNDILYGGNGPADVAAPSYDEAASDMVVRRARDLGLSAAQIPPTVLKGFADIAQLASAGHVGADASHSMQDVNADLNARKSTGARIQAIEFDRASKAGSGATAFNYLLDNPGFLLEQAIPSIGSMALPIAGAGAASRIAQASKWLKALPAAERAAALEKIREATVLGTTVVQNSADTFADTKGSATDRYTAAGIAAAGTALAGKMFDGGAEQALSRSLSGKAGGAGVLGTILKEGGQEGVEGMSQNIGQQVGETGEVDPRAAIRQGVIEGTLGAVIGGGAGIAHPVVAQAFGGIANDHGLSPKAAAAIQTQAATMPPQAQAAFIERALAAMEKRGLAKKLGAAMTWRQAVQPVAAVSATDGAQTPSPASEEELGWGEPAAPTALPGELPRAEAAQPGTEATASPPATGSTWQGQPFEPAGQPVAGPDGRQYLPALAAGKPVFIPVDEIQGGSDLGDVERGHAIAGSGHDALPQQDPSRTARAAEAPSMGPIVVSSTGEILQVPQAEQQPETSEVTLPEPRGLAPASENPPAQPTRRADFTSEDDVRQYLSEQRRNAGIRISAAPVQTEAGWSFVTKDEPGYGEARAAAVARDEQRRAIDAAAHEAATSPKNDHPEPTQAQKEANNYKAGHLSWNGLGLTIENPKGSERKGIDPDGKPWKVRLAAHYGYIKRTEGADGDHVDIYMGPNPDSKRVFVVDQVRHDTGAFDEHKVVLGADTADQAQQLYDAGFSDGKGPQRRAAMTEMSVDEFKAWARDGVKSEPLGLKPASAAPQESAAPTQEGASPAQADQQSAGDSQLGASTEQVPATPEQQNEQASEQAPVGPEPLIEHKTGKRTIRGYVRKLTSAQAVEIDPLAFRKGEKGHYFLRKSQADAWDARQAAASEMAQPDYWQKRLDARREASGKVAPTSTAAEAANARSPTSAGAMEERFPRVRNIPAMAVGPTGIEPREIATGKRLYRETSVSGLDDLLYSDGRADVRPMFVADNVDLAIGQGRNKGVHVEFREGSLSGREHEKPGTGDIAGREYAVDMIAPRAVAAFTVPATFKPSLLRGLPRRVLSSEFDRQELADGRARYVRKGLEDAVREPAVSANDASKLASDGVGSGQAMWTDATPLERTMLLMRIRDANPVNSTIAKSWKDLTSTTRAQIEQVSGDSGRSADSIQKLVDAGEKIGGARKDRWKERGLDLSDLDAMTESEGAELATKANVWKPNYESMSMQADPLTAAMVKTIYDQLAATPKDNTPEGRRRYVTAMQAVRQIYGGAKNPDDVRGGYLALRDRLGMSDAARKSEATKALFSVYKGRSDPFVLGYNEIAKAEKMVRDGFPSIEPWRSRFSVREDGGAGLTPRGIEITVDLAAEVGTPITQEQAKAGVFRVVDKKGQTLAYEVTQGEAEARAKALYEAIKGQGSDKEEPSRPHLDNLQREGMAETINRDVTPDDLLKDFGFRGIEFGNWAAQDERQKILNHVYDALADLAKILNVPKAALSLNGTMGMAFGARGGGRFAAHYEPGKLVINMTKLRGAGSLAHEWAHAFDHYLGELDRRDAYQTKARGASGWHDQQNYDGKSVTRTRREPDGSWSTKKELRLQNLRPELAAKIDAVMQSLYSVPIPLEDAVKMAEADVVRQESYLGRETVDPAIRKLYEDGLAGAKQALQDLLAGKIPEQLTMSSFAREASNMSGSSGNGYWIRPTEMFARAFESYVFDRLQAMGARSDYLVHGVEQDRYADDRYKGNPYPAGEERKAINKAFDDLVAEIRTKGTPKGVAIFRTGASVALPIEKRLTDAAIADEVEQRIGKFAHQPAIRIRDSAVGTLPGTAVDDGVAGAVHQGAIYLFRDQLASRLDVQRTLFHELLHYGLRRFLTQDTYVAEMLRLYDRDAAVRRRADEWATSSEGDTARRFGGEAYARARGVDEALAELAEPNGGIYLQQGVLARTYRRVLTWLAKLADVLGFDRVAAELRGVKNQEARVLVESIFRRIADGAPAAAAGDFPADPAFSHVDHPKAAVDERDPVSLAMRKAGLAGIDLRMKIRDRVSTLWQLISDRSAAADKLIQGTLDQFHGIKQAVQSEVGNLPVEQDPYIAARLANGGTSSVMRALLLHGQAQWAKNRQHLEKIDGTRGLLAILGELGPELNNWFGWMIGNRAARLMGEGRENNFTAEDIRALKSLGAGKEAQFRKVAREYAAFKRSVLDVAEGAGLIDGEARAVWDKADYIPFYRQVDGMGALSATGRKGLAGQSAGIRILKGGTSELNDPIENLLMNFSRLIDASLKNNALRKTVYILGDSDLLTRVEYEVRSAEVPASQVKKVLEDAGMPPAMLGAVPPETFSGMAKMWRIAPPTDPDVIRIMRKGKAEYYRVNDPLLLRAATSFVPFNFPGLNALRFFKRVLTATVTATPEFMARNFVRDTLASGMITRDGFHPGKSIAGVLRAYKEDGAYEPLLFAGASFQSGNVNAADPAGTGRAMRRALREKGFDASSVESFMGSIFDGTAAAWEKYRKVGEAIENANREAVFEAALKNKKSATAAAYEAKDLMDFSLRGSWPVYQFFADTLPFFNARVQGLYRLARTDPKRLAKYGALMMVASLGLALMNAGNDEYEKLPDWDKDGYWHVWIGGHHFRFPKPFELGVAFATIPERVLRYALGQDTGKKTLKRIWANVRDQLAFDLVPQAFRPMLDVYANKDSFRGSPIEGAADEGKRPSERYSATTSETAKAAVQAMEPVANELGLSPKRLEFLVNGYLGTAGSYALGVSDMAIRAVAGGPSRPAIRADDIPVVKAFYRVDPARATVFEADLFELRREVDAIYRSYAAMQREGDAEGAAKILLENRDELSARGAIDAGADRLARLSKQRERIYRDPKMPPDQKREELDRIAVQRSDIARRVLETSAVVPLR